MKTFLVIVLTAVLAVAATWLSMRHHPGATAAAASAPQLYQCGMHPWIRSDQPGRCTLCGMELTPVATGANKTAGTARPDQVVELTQNQIGRAHV